MRKEFTVHMLNDAGREKARQIAESYDQLLGYLETVCTGDARCLAIARTKLEESCFFAKKSMAEDVVNIQTGNGSSG